MADESWTFTQSGTDESWTFSDGVGPTGPAGADGADGADGSDANVTNANVNTAISTNVSATMSTLGAVSIGTEDNITGTKNFEGSVYFNAGEIEFSGNAFVMDTGTAGDFRSALRALGETNADVNTAIATDPAATRTAAAVDSSAQIDASFHLRLTPTVRAYAARTQLTSRDGIQRIDQFVKGCADESLTITEAVFLGEGLNLSTDVPITFINFESATNTPTTTHTVETHGRTVTSGGALYKFPIPAVSELLPPCSGS